MNKTEDKTIAFNSAWDKNTERLSMVSEHIYKQVKTVEV